MSTLSTLPGSIPGLLRRCSPVVTSDGRRGVYCGGYTLSGGGWRYICTWVEDGCAAMPSFDNDPPALDLTDPTGQAHAAWWYLRQPTARLVSASEVVAWDAGGCAAACASGCGDERSAEVLRRAVLHVAGLDEDSP